MLVFVKPDFRYRKEYTDMMEEWTKEGGRIAPWPLELAYQSDVDFENLLRKMDDAYKGNNNGEYAPSSTFWVIEVETGKMIGAANIRHYLKGSKEDIWGHIGYGVRPSERRKGQATSILKMSLEECRKLSIDKVLIVCFESNTGSAKVIENNGGVFDNLVWAEDGNEYIKRFWIRL